MKDIYNTFDEEGHVIELIERCRTKEVLKTVIIIVLIIFCIGLTLENRNLKIDNYKLRQDKPVEKIYNNSLKNC